MGFIALRMWGLLGPGMDPVSPALTGGFFSTEPQGQPPFVYFCLYFYCFLYIFVYITIALEDWPKKTLV